MSLHWQADKKRDYEIFERIGSLTFWAADRLALSLIESKTGFDFNERMKERRKLYLQVVRDQTLVEAFASVLLRSVGCRTVADPPKTVGLLPPVEWTPLNIVVNIFFSTMPSAYYDTFKNMLRDRSDLFPHDD